MKFAFCQKLNKRGVDFGSFLPVIYKYRAFSKKKGDGGGGLG